MEDKTRQDIVSLKGRLKFPVSSKTSVNGDEYFSSPLEIIEIERNGQKIDHHSESIFLIF
jgi:hypothetical protein